MVGALRGEELGGDGTATAGEVMSEGPGTNRPSMSAADAASSMDSEDRDALIVTRPDGVLLGIVTRDDLPSGG